jgi:hypothetical protein
MLRRYSAEHDAGRSVEMIMKYIVFVTALLCLSGGCALRSTPTAEVKSAPKRDVYTDAEAQAFLGKLPGLKYPTTIHVACTQLGIELARLGVDTSKPIQTQLASLDDGGIQSRVSQLSDSYSIAFHHNINDKTPNKYQIYEIRIWEFRNRDE